MTSSSTSSEPPASERARPRLGVFKLASFDGCQLTLLDCEDEFLELAAAIDIVHFVEASSRVPPRGPFDLVLVEGSVSNVEQLHMVREIRANTRHLVTIGVCATAGGIQSLRNFADHNEYLRIVYATPRYIDTLATAPPVAQHIPVDFELRGCPIGKHQLLEVVSWSRLTPLGADGFDIEASTTSGQPAPSSAPIAAPSARTHRTAAITPSRSPAPDAAPRCDSKTPAAHGWRDRTPPSMHGR